VIRIVIDASAAVEYLLRTPLGQKLDDLIEDAFLLAPALLDVEVLSVLRRALLQKKIEEHRARLALEDLGAWPVERVPHSALLREAWKHRHNVSYVAVAKLYDAQLLTADGPLSRAPGLGIVVQNIRLG
jgi:predicted nucleic acid-binding protein